MVVVVAVVAPQKSCIISPRKRKKEKRGKRESNPCLVRVKGGVDVQVLGCTSQPRPDGAVETGVGPWST